MRKIIALFVLGLVFIVSGCTPSSDPDPNSNQYYLATTNTKITNLSEIKEKVLGQNPYLAPIFDKLVDGKLSANAITYRSKGRDGGLITVSGLIVYPTDVPIKGFICGPNHTITSNREAPTVSMVALNGIFALFGYAVVIPDYIGFGETASLPHPYVQKDLTGQVCADMILAAREFFAEKQITLPQQVSIVGYSQGGASALFAQRVIEEKYASIQLKKVYSGGGPNYLSKTFDYYIQTDYTGYPCSVPYVIIGADYAQNLNLNYANVFKSPLLENYNEWFNSKKYNSTEVNNFLGSNTISTFMHDDMFKPEMNADLKSIRQACTLSDNVDWTPKAPIYLLHSRTDDYVPFFNSEDAYNSFVKRGATVEFTKPVSQSHMEAMVTFYLNVITDLTK